MYENLSTFAPFFRLLFFEHKIKENCKKQAAKKGRYLHYMFEQNKFLKNNKTLRQIKNKGHTRTTRNEKSPCNPKLQYNRRPKEQRHTLKIFYSFF